MANRRTSAPAPAPAPVLFDLMAEEQISIGSETDKAYIFEFAQTKRDGTEYTRKLVVPKSICTLDKGTATVTVPLWKLLRYDLESQEQKK